MGLADYFYIYLAVLFGFPAEVGEIPDRATVERVTHFVKLDTRRIT